MVDDPTDVLARLEAALAKLDELRDTPLPCARIRGGARAPSCGRGRGGAAAARRAGRVTHPYDSTCSCATCRHTSLALQERPDRATAPVVDDPIGKIIAACSGPWLPPVSLAEMLGARARSEVKLYPDAAAASLARWQQLSIEAFGETPASRAASDEDLCRGVRQRLSVLVDCAAIIADLRAQLAVARDLARQHRRDLEVVLSDLRSGAYDPTELYVVNALREQTVDDALAGLQVDAALMRAGEAVPRG